MIDFFFVLDNSSKMSLHFL